MSQRQQWARLIYDRERAAGATQDAALDIISLELEDYDEEGRPYEFDPQPVYEGPTRKVGN